MLFLWCMTFLVLMLAMMVHAQADDITRVEAENFRWYALGAAIVMGLAGLGAAQGMGNASAAAMGALIERPEVFGKAMIFIVMLEAIAIYGLVIAILLIGLITV